MGKGPPFAVAHMNYVDGKGINNKGMFCFWLVFMGRKSTNVTNDISLSAPGCSTVRY